MFCLESCWNPSEEHDHSGSVGRSSETGWSGPDLSHSIWNAHSGAAAPLRWQKTQKTNKKQKAEQKVSESPTGRESYGHGDVVDGDPGASPAGVGQEGLSENVTSRWSGGQLPLGKVSVRRELLP